MLIICTNKLLNFRQMQIIISGWHIWNSHNGLLTSAYAVDKVSMSRIVLETSSFLDHRIVEFSTALKANRKMPDEKTTKYILKKAVESILPKDIIYRRKQGFAAPVKNGSEGMHKYAKMKLLTPILFKIEFSMRNTSKSLLQNIIHIKLTTRNKFSHF
jgi:asparagine synthetase B (glutamine-hydrolysing)